MILIRKGQEPKELREHRSRPGSAYDDMPKEAKAALKASLHAEQKGLCAYCTCRISADVAKQDPQEPMTVEHLYPQHPINGETREGWDLRYRNMLAVCSGNRGCGSEKDLTCDARKGNRIIRLNPCDESIVSRIHYRSDGTIYSDGKALDEELNTALNLNCAGRQLPENRKAALDKVQEYLRREPHFKRACAKFLNALMEHPTPFCGMAIEWLRKKTGR